MNIKVRLIEKERSAYIENRTKDAAFYDELLMHVISLEETINERDKELEEIHDDTVNTHTGDVVERNEKP